MPILHVALMAHKYVCIHSKTAYQNLFFIIYVGSTQKNCLIETIILGT